MKISMVFLCAAFLFWSLGARAETQYRVIFEQNGKVTMCSPPLPRSLASQATQLFPKKDGHSVRVVHVESEEAQRQCIQWSPERIR